MVSISKLKGPNLMTDDDGAIDCKSRTVVLVNAMQQMDVEQGNECRSCQTTFLRLAEEGREFELVFFRRLNFEFNKVIQFYQGKVKEAMK
ncbi:hypothetical protein L1887_11212 [Cichorium endivia]|nr:hypothetical protein L1887_11212 [Cichorium endivia]